MSDTATPIVGMKGIRGRRPRVAPAASPRQDLAGSLLAPETGRPDPVDSARPTQADHRLNSPSRVALPPLSPADSAFGRPHLATGRCAGSSAVHTRSAVLARRSRRQGRFRALPWAYGSAVVDTPRELTRSARMTSALRRLWLSVALPLALLALVTLPGEPATLGATEEGCGRSDKRRRRAPAKAKKSVKKTARSKAKAARKGPPPTPAKGPVRCGQIAVAPRRARPSVSMPRAASPAARRSRSTARHGR